MTPSLSAVLDHLWQSTVFAGVVWLLTLALRRNRARVRHGLWLAASCKFLIPFSLLIALGGQIQWRKAPPKAQYQVAMVANQVSEPFTGRSEIVLPSSAASRRNPLPAVLFGIWAIGFVGVGATWLIRWRRIGAAVRAGSPVELEIPIRVVSSRARLEPGVFGIWRPVLLLPEGIDERLTAEQLAAVIEHELCHVRHHDNLTAAVHMMVEAMFWFHPLVWWIEKWMVEERERACDEEVVRRVSDSRAYAEGILNVCKLYIGSPLACVSGVGGANLRRRLEAIISRKRGMKLDGTRKAALAAAGAIAVGVPVGIGLVNAPFVHAQTSAKFEVASIRLGCGGGGGREGGKGGPGGGKSGPAVPPSSPGRLSVCLPLVNRLGAGPIQVGLVPDAYGTYANGHRNPPWMVPRIEGGPAWIGTDRYAISARAANDASVEAMQGPMMQALLEDRFQLKMHRETRELPVYDLVIAKGGAKLKPFQEGTCEVMDWTKPLPPPDPARKGCNSMVTIRNSPNMLLAAQGATLEQLCFLMGLALDRPVVDKTGLKGLYDIDLEFGPEGTSLPPPPGKAAPEASEPGPSIFTAVQEQLGLRLESGKGPREVLVIDHIERPSEN